MWLWAGHEEFYMVGVQFVCGNCIIILCVEIVL